MKTVEEIIANLGTDQVSRRIFWEAILLRIQRKEYQTALDTVLQHRQDSDFADQLRCTAESIARHVETHGNYFQRTEEKR